MKQEQPFAFLLGQLMLLGTMAWGRRGLHRGPGGGGMATHTGFCLSLVLDLPHEVILQVSLHCEVCGGPTLQRP